MKKFLPELEKLFHCTEIKALVLYGMIAFGLLAPMGSLNVLPNIMDTPNHIESIIQAKKAIYERQVPLRVAPTLLNGWQYPLFQFYFPTPYAVGGFIYGFITKENPYQAYAITIWLALIVGAYGIFLLCDRFISSKKISILSGVAYITAPYILLNIHARGGFTEVFSQAILPYVLFFCLQIFLERKIYWVALGGVDLIMPNYPFSIIPG